VVHVAHDSDHRRAGLQAGFILLGGAGRGPFRRYPGHLRYGRLLGLESQVMSDDGRRVVVNDLVDAGHYAVPHELLDDLDGRYAQEVCELLDGEGAGDFEDADGGANTRGLSRGYG
jgi:hypothetical protein